MWEGKHLRGRIQEHQQLQLQCWKHHALTHHFVRAEHHPLETSTGTWIRAPLVAALLDSTPFSRTIRHFTAPILHPRNTSI